MTTSSCGICSAVQDALSARRFLWNKPLYETKYFFVLPTIGPFEEGHCMIVSKDHQLSLLSMNKESRQNFLNIIDLSIERFGSNVLFTEHGSFSEQQKAGSCIEHTHIHIIPRLASFYNVLDEVLPISNEILKLEKLNQDFIVDFTYILSFNPNNQLRLYNAYNAHSQMMRKAICAKTNRSDWDWKQNKKEVGIKKTIELWEN